MRVKVICVVCEKQGIVVVLDGDSSEPGDHFKKEHPLLWAHVKANKGRKWQN